MPLTEREKALIKLVIERAEQSCRYVWKHQDIEPGEYARGFEIACDVCEKSIESHVMRHIEKDAERELPARLPHGERTDG